MSFLLCSIFLVGMRFLNLDRVAAFRACADIDATSSLCSLTASGVARNPSMPLIALAKLSARLRETPSTSAITSVCPSARSCKTLSSLPKWSVSFLAKPAPIPGIDFKTIIIFDCQGFLNIRVGELNQ